MPYLNNYEIYICIGPAVRASCCTSWSNSCYTTASAENNNHACNQNVPEPCETACSNAASDECKNCCVAADHETPWNCPGTYTI